MKAALIGLIQSGKSTIMSAISGKGLPQAGGINIEEAIVSVPDERLDWLAGIYKPKKLVHGTIDCLDVPGFNFADEAGRNAARRSISKIRSVDMLVYVLRAFDNPDVQVYKNKIDAKRDLEELKTELLLADLELVSTRIENLEKQMNKPTKTQGKDKAELELQLKLQECIEAEKPLSTVLKTDAELEMVKSLGFLTLKPMVVLVNVGEDGLDEKFDFGDMLETETPVIEFCAKLELELSQLDKESKVEFMSDLGIKESAISKFVRSCYSAMGMISFLTVGPDEVRAWPIQAGTSALEAAGKIHSDIKRGFIRAEKFTYGDLRELGDEKAVKADGRFRLEGKEYIVGDGDILNFRFNV